MVLLLPTARQFVLLVHETPLKRWLAAPGGLATIDQLVPFQCSIDRPTATHDDGLVHETPFSSFVPGCATVYEVVPFQCSIAD